MRRRKGTLSDRLRPPGLKMCLVPPPAGRRIVTGPSAVTQTWPKYAPGLHLRGRSGRPPALARACLAGAHLLRLPRYYLRAARCSLSRAALMVRLGLRERAQLGRVALAGH
jgi:hypothetical protein